MHSGNFEIFANDRALPSLANLTARSLTSALTRHIDTNLLDADIDSYTVSNLRYKPKGKMVLGLTAPISQRPIAVRIFAPGNLQRRLKEARCHHPQHVFALPELNGLAWVFPGEKKIDLNPVADTACLKALLKRHRDFDLRSMKLERFVPEHTYTASVTGYYPGSELLTEYLKLHYSNAGDNTAQVMHSLAAQLIDKTIEVPGKVFYLAKHKLLVQAGLCRDEGARASDADIARALACLHGLPLRDKNVKVNATSVDSMHELKCLLETTFPRWSERVITACDRVHRALNAACPSRSIVHVPVHGDVHLGNFFPLKNGRIGVIDFDSFGMGEAEDDLCGYYGFKLWLALRQGESLEYALAQLPVFIDCYNSCAHRSISLKRAYLFLAKKILTERIRRGLARGKLSGEQELLDFLDCVDLCLTAANRVAA